MHSNASTKGILEKLCRRLNKALRRPQVRVDSGDFASKKEASPWVAKDEWNPEGSIDGAEEASVEMVKVTIEDSIPVINQQGRSVGAF